MGRAANSAHFSANQKRKQRQQAPAYASHIKAARAVRDTPRCIAWSDARHLGELRGVGLCQRWDAFLGSVESIDWRFMCEVALAGQKPDLAVGLSLRGGGGSQREKPSSCTNAVHLRASEGRFFLL
jgi:hypothetical protein